MNRTNRTERGQAIVIIAVAIFVLTGIAALAVDGGLYYADRRKAQNAADSAVLAASLARLRGEDFVSAALLNAEKNGYRNDGERSEVLVAAPPASGPYEGDREYVQVTVVSRHKTYFGAVVGIRELLNSAQAVSRAVPPKFGPILKDYASSAWRPTPAARTCGHSGRTTKRPCSYMAAAFLSTPITPVARSCKRGAPAWCSAIPPCSSTSWAASPSKKWS